MTTKTQTKTTPAEHKTLPIYLVKSDDSLGIIEAVVNVFGIVDLGGDIIHNGAYTKTLNERGNAVKVRVLDSHNTDSVLRVIGKPLEIRELGRAELAMVAPKVLQDHPEATGGLFTRTQFLMNTPEGKGVYERLAAGAVDEWSIALDPLQVDYGKALSADGKEVTIRNIHQIRLYEYSPVIWGMNQATATTDIKSDGDERPEAEAPTEAAVEKGAPEQKQATLGSRLEASMRMTAAYCITDWLGEGTIDGDTVAMLNGAVDTAMSVLRTTIPANVADQPLMSYWGGTGAPEQKAGRVISGANRAKIQQAIDALQALMDASAVEDVPAADTTDGKAIDETPDVLPVTGSQAKAASIIELADIDRELSDVNLMMEMTA